VNGNRTEQDWASELWPDDGTDPDWPDPDWPDDRRERGRLPAVVAGSGRHGPRGLALALTAAVALGAGAGAVYLYKSAVAAPAPASAASSPSPGGSGAEESVMMLGRVLAVANDSVTVGGPGQAISARATSATKFTGKVRSLAQVRVGDTVSAEITVSGGAATLVRLQDPASQP
jgi:hypothetical protein